METGIENEAEKESYTLETIYTLRLRAHVWLCVGARFKWVLSWARGVQQVWGALEGTETKECEVA